MLGELISAIWRVWMRIDVNLIKESPNSNHQSNVDGGAKIGTYKGERLVIRSELSKLESAKEEMTFHFSEKVEGEVATKMDVEAEFAIKVMKVDEILAYLKSAQAFQTPGELVALARRLLEGNGSVRNFTTNATSDPTQQYLLLQFSIFEGESSGASTSRIESIREALSELEFESSAAIHAGLNSIDAATQFGVTPNDIALFQSTYRDLVIGNPSLAETLQTLFERFGDREFSKGLNSLLKALGNDLSATRPSIDTIRLQLLIEDIYRLEVFNTIIDEASSLGARLARVNHCSKFSPTQYLKELVSITTERWINSGRFTSIPAKFEISEMPTSILLLTQAMRSLSEMPVKVFASLDARRDVLTAAQLALDEIIEAEDDDEFDDRRTKKDIATIGQSRIELD